MKKGIGEELDEIFSMNADGDEIGYLVSLLSKNVLQDKEAKAQIVLNISAEENEGMLHVESKRQAFDRCPVTGILLPPFQKMKDLLLLSSPKGIECNDDNFDASVRVLLSSDSNLKKEAVHFLSEGRIFFRRRLKEHPHIIWPLCQEAALTLAGKPHEKTREAVMDLLFTIVANLGLHHPEGAVNRTFLVILVQSIHEGTVKSKEAAVLTLGLLAQSNTETSLLLGKMNAIQDLVDVLHEEKVGIGASVALHELLRQKTNRERALKCYLTRAILNDAVRQQIQCFETHLPSALVLLATNQRGAKELLLNGGFDRLIGAMERGEAREIWDLCVLAIKEVWSCLPFMGKPIIVPRGRVEGLLTKIAREANAETQKQIAALRLMLASK